MSPSISTKAQQSDVSRAKRHSDHFGKFEMAAYQQSIFRSRFDWNDSHWFRRLATRSSRFDGIKLLSFYILRSCSKTGLIS